VPEEFYEVLTAQIKLEAHGPTDGHGVDVRAPAVRRVELDHRPGVAVDGGQTLRL
jgi:hypothetical protein